MDPAGEESTDRREDLKDKLGLDGIAGRATTQAHTSRSVRNLQPEGLRLQPVERQFIPLLGPLLPTPRAAKKLLNLYRLIRIGVAEQDLSAFVGDTTAGPYQAVLLLLGILVGSPALARPLLSELRTSSSADFFSLLREMPDAQPASSCGRNAKTGDWRQLIDAVDKVRKTLTARSSMIWRCIGSGHRRSPDSVSTPAI
jgi:hypothetical protein